MYLEISRRFEFSSALRLFRREWTDEENVAAFGKAAWIHGHGRNFIVDVSVSGTVDPVNGMIVNLRDLDMWMNAILADFDHKNLNEDVPEFKDLVPTTENLSIVLWDRIGGVLPDGVTLERVRVYESADVWIDCHGTDRVGAFQSFGFVAAHRLHSSELSTAENTSIFGKCNHVHGHGHSYDVEVGLAARPDPVTGRAEGLAELRAVCGDVATALDYTDIDRDVELLNGKVSTVENLLSSLWKLFHAKFHANLMSIRLHETRRNSGSVQCAG
jgi:6-pyruvoyltetrahydropterin/6-carboxytetrahydropterin synthase